MKKPLAQTKSFNTQRSVEKAAVRKPTSGISTTKENKLARVATIRAGVPYETIDALSKRLNNPVAKVLGLVGIPQTTYNRKKSDHQVLDARNSELVLLISDLIDYGLDVFNNEEAKFQRWLKKPNLSIGGYTPESLLDTVTGINEVRYSLNRLNWGNLA